MAVHLGIETIVARYMRDLVKTLESKSCEYCAVGEWRVDTIGLHSRVGKPGFDIFIRVRCNECLGVSALSWVFDPYQRKAPL